MVKSVELDIPLNSRIMFYIKCYPPDIGGCLHKFKAPMTKAMTKATVNSMAAKWYQNKIEAKLFRLFKSSNICYTFGSFFISNACFLKGT